MEMLLTDNMSAEKFAFISNFPFKKKKTVFCNDERLGTGQIGDIHYSEILEATVKRII